MHPIHHSFLLYLLAFSNLLATVHLGLYMVGANTYDILKFKKTKTLTRPRRGPKRRKWPLVSIVIPAHNETLGIERTLNSVLASSYKKFEIIIIDDGSTDKTAATVRSYIKKYPRLRAKSYVARYKWSSELERRYIRGQLGRTRVLLVSQKNAGKAGAMNNAITHHVRGELTMCLDADSILHPEAISRAVDYFKDRKVIGVAANVRIMSSKQWLGVLQRFEHMIGYRSKKFFSLTNSEFIIGGVASTYRTQVLRRAGLYDTDTMTEDIGLSLKLIATKGNKRHRIVYAADVVAMTEGVQTFRGLLRQRYRWKMGNLQNLFKYRRLIASTDRRKYSRMLTSYRMPMAVLSEIMLLLEPLVLSYVVYLSISYHTAGILFGAYLTLTAYVLWTVWPDEHLTNRQKAGLSLLALGMYVIFYAMDLVQLYAAYQCLRNRRTIIRRNGETTWVSPLRSGQAASF
jgi:cellulose synthase/poly-beta-1,6-N-acetylglucosamine synthase-like glycosyltransferase